MLSLICPPCDYCRHNFLAVDGNAEFEDDMQHFFQGCEVSGNDFFFFACFQCTVKVGK